MRSPYCRIRSWGLISSRVLFQSGGGPEAIQYLAWSAPSRRTTRSISATISIPGMPGLATSSMV